MPYREKVLVNENGKSTGRTAYIQEMSPETYKRESRSISYSNFLKSRSLDDVKLALARDEGPKATRFLQSLIDPKNKDVDIAVLAQIHGISFNDLLTIWRSDKLNEAFCHMFDGVPVVAQHTVKDAESVQVCCPRCDGGGTMKVQIDERTSKWISCVNCQGTGIIRKIGDAKARQQVLEATGILKSSSSGVTILNMNGAASAVESVLDDLERITIPVTVENV